MNTTDGNGSRRLERAVWLVVFCVPLAAGSVLSPMTRTLAQSALGRIAVTVGPALHYRPGGATGRQLASTHGSGLLPGPLNGEPTPRANALRRPIAVTIDNYYPDSRPQSGLGDASVVFETLVEGGFTRLMALYLEHDPAVVGPVRSTRIYFDDWAAAYHAILVHVGGNDDADAQLWQMRPVYNLDQGSETFLLGYANPYFWRSADRSIPDNMYANIPKLRAYATKRGQDWRYTQAALPHKQPEPEKARGGPGALTISFVDPLYPSMPALPDYQVQYRFDPSTDSYLRVVGGAPQIDAASNKTIRAQNVVAMLMGSGSPDLAAGSTVDAVNIPVIGSGSAEYFRDGRVEHGIWQQSDPLAPLRFLNAQGKPVKFNPGQTWIEVLPSSSKATWAVQAQRAP